MNDKEWWEDGRYLYLHEDINKLLPIVPKIIQEAQRLEREEIVRIINGMREPDATNHPKECVCDICCTDQLLIDVINAIKPKSL